MADDAGRHAHEAAPREALQDTAHDDAALLRYSRHILLDQWGIEGQARIERARVLVVGAGGLGCPAALYLAAAGIGRLVIADPDEVDLTNLQRQILFQGGDIGTPKVDAARRTLSALNPGVVLETVHARLAGARLDDAVAGVDLVLDCSDNFTTRHAVNRACVAHRKVLVAAAAVRFDGQISVFDLRSPAAPCYACLFPESDAPDEIDCATLGVFAPLTGVLGALAAGEALKSLAGLAGTLAGRLMLFDALGASWQSIRLERDPGCAVCGARDLPA